MATPAPPPIEIRDPIHGAIVVDKDELAIVDHPYVQRLRNVRQLGFAHLPFPGATHTRYSHSLGAMELAGRAFDACFRDAAFSSPTRRDALRRCTRIAALCHDLGHAPFSHAVEFAMPPLRALGIEAYAPGRVADRLDRQSHHEDYTIAILTRSSLADAVRARFAFLPEHVAVLVSPDVEPPDDFFREDGRDLQGVLSQIVSSDLDVDRMDYLVRDSYYSGARYGQVDVDWLIGNLATHEPEPGRVCLALDRRAIYAFDDFMIARFHMFVMVYFHQKSVAYEEMLKRWVQSPGCDWRLPADLDAYLEADDAQLWGELRRSSDPWARRVVEMRPYRVALEVHGTPEEVDLAARREVLARAGIDTLEASSIGAVFKAPKPGAPAIWVVGRGRPAPLHEATAIFERYQDERCIGRLYVPEEDAARARELVGNQ